MKKLILRSSLIMVSLILLMFTVVFAQDVRQFVAQKVSFKVVVNGEEKTFNDPIVTIDNKTYVPLREVSNNLGLDVKWDANNQKIELNSKQTTSYDGLLPFAKDGLYGYMDQDGNIKIKPQFYRASYFSEGLAEVTKKEFGGIGFINEKGDVVIPYHGLHVGECLNHKIQHHRKFIVCNSSIIQSCFYGCDDTERHVNK